MMFVAFVRPGEPSFFSVCDLEGVEKWRFVQFGTFADMIYIDTFVNVPPATIATLPLANVTHWGVFMRLAMQLVVLLLKQIEDPIILPPTP